MFTALEFNDNNVDILEMTRGRADVPNVGTMSITEKKEDIDNEPCAIGLEPIFKVSKLGNHADSASISAHDRMLFETNAMCFIFCD